ncbi:MAG TPA: F0F1 ATP synthase subunit delta [Candidatus Saccharimonadales bacterium]|nr:F0F1 ATP synthase subunit delta [Candidatus Saccharimonadales bacterium]
MKFKLPDGVSSPQDLQSLILEVREYAKWQNHNATKKRLAVRKTTPAPELSPATMELLKELGVSPTPSNLDDLITTLQKFARSAPQISITLAAPPSLGIKKMLVGWCRENISPNILVNFQFNAVLLGGMVVRYGSHIHDWSFRRQILENRTKFPGVLRNV